jgi:hypothetical protein
MGQASAVFVAAASSLAASGQAAGVGMEVLRGRREEVIVKLPVLAREIRDP